MKKELLITLYVFFWGVLVKGSSQEKLSPEKSNEKVQAERLIDTIDNIGPDKRKFSWRVFAESNLSFNRSFFKGENLYNPKDDDNSVFAKWMVGEIRDLNVAKIDLMDLYDQGELGVYSSLWELYINNTIDVNLALEKLSSIPIPPGRRIDRKLEYYFSEIQFIQDYEISDNLFKRGALKMGRIVSSVPTSERTLAGLEDRIKQNFISASFEEKLGALVYLDDAFYYHYRISKAEDSYIELDYLVKNMIAYQSGEEGVPEMGGLCRHFAFLTAKIAEESFDLKSLAINGRDHIMAQVLGSDKNFAVIDRGSVITNLNGYPLSNKDDIDIVVKRLMGKSSLVDVSIDPAKNTVIYENRYNNFAGFWKKLQNRDNSERMREFLMDNHDFKLFNHMNERGVARSSIQRENIGLQAYWVWDDNEYRRFLESAEGLNLAVYLPEKYSLSNSRLDHTLFSNLGFYRIVMDLGPVDCQPEKYSSTFDFQLNIEDYLKYSLNRYLSTGLVMKLIQYNRELSRSGDDVDRRLKRENYTFFSPFVGFTIPQSNGRVCYFSVGSEITDYWALPNSWHLNAIPWFQLGFTKQKQGLAFDASLRGEFQWASRRFDWVSHLKKDSHQLELRVFFEHYTQDFKGHNLFKDGAGIEIGIAQYFKKGRQVFAAVSGKADNCGTKSTLINLGVKF